MVEPDKIILVSTLTCPRCGHARQESMPVDYCLYFYTCSECRASLQPGEGDCCVFCSYGDVPCPSMQLTSG